MVSKILYLKIGGVLQAASVLQHQRNSNESDSEKWVCMDRHMIKCEEMMRSHTMFARRTVF